VADRSVGEVRKTVTVLFCDVTGSTALAERLDPESMRALMSRYFAEMKAVLERHGGVVEKFIGDAVMAVFGIPAVHEDDALRAVRAAAEMRTALATLNEQLERDHGVRIASRIGVTTGEVVAGDPTGGQSLVTGDPVNVAARLEQAAAPGQILLGELTHRLVRAAVISEPVEPLSLKGKSDRVPAFVLLEVEPRAPGRTPQRDLPMVGRRDELGVLQGSLRRATGERRCIRATVIGPAGVGKSRLVDEFVSVATEDVQVVHGRCLSYGEGITYWPVVEILTAIAGLEDGDGPDKIRSRIGGLLEGTAEAALIAERLAELLGLTGAIAASEETHWAVRRLFETLAARKPLVAVFEDVHWAEPALLDLIEHVTDLAGSDPIVLLCTARPELLEERPAWARSEPGSVALTIEALTHEQADELIEHLVGSAGLPVEARSIVGAGEGNPLFLEQLVGMLIDEGHLRREGDAWVVVDDLKGLSIPSTIKGVLEARLERLPPTERDVLECGSVEGREFHRASAAMAPTSDRPSADLSRVLESLVRRGLVEPVAPLLGGGEAFRFRHALIRDAAYARMPKATRSRLHEGLGRWLERTAGERAPEFEDLIAYHLEQATRLRADLGPLSEDGRELRAEAARRLASAGRRAVGRGDVRAASGLFERALGLLDPDDLSRPDVLVRLADAYSDQGDIGRAIDRLEEGRAAAMRIGERRGEIRAEIARGILRLSSEPGGVTEEIDRVTAEGIPILEELGDDEGLARAWKGSGEVALMRANGADMIAAYERAAHHAERAGARAALADALGWLALAAWLGMMRPADTIRHARDLRERLPDGREVEAMASISEGYSLAMLGRFAEGRALHLYGHRILEELGLRMKAAGTQQSAGRIEMLADDLPAAEREFRMGYEALASMGELGYLSTQAAELGEVRYRLGDLDEAEEFSHVSEEACDSDDIVSQIQWRGVRAKVLARRGRLDEAIRLAEQAVALTDRIDFWELRSDALANQAEVYELAGRTGDSVHALRRSLEILEAKGVVPLIERIRRRLERSRMDDRPNVGGSERE
jgi:class 3 adenylate cyclase/tetratricopeptide (TPR) repeat protein